MAQASITNEPADESAILAEWQDEARELATFVSSVCAPPSDEPTEDFAEKHVIVQDGPFAGTPWRKDFTPLAPLIFARMRHHSTRRFILMMSAQYIKTLSLLINFLRNAKHDPAATMWVMADAESMSEFIDKRLMPYIEACDVVAPLFVRKVKNLIQFQGMNLMLRGANSRAKLQSDPVRDVYCDERREWKKGSIDLLRKRMRTFPNAREISAGTAGVENDELHLDYKEGTQTRGHIRCLHCGHSQPIRFGKDKTCMWPARECGGFVWEESERTKSNGIWNYDEVTKTVRFECENPKCRALYVNAQKYELLRTMHTHDYNPNPLKGVVSFSGCAFEAIWESCDWDKLVLEFLRAVDQAKLGNLEPLKTFITETLGEPWEDRLGVIEDFGFLEARKAPYKYGEVWAEEKRRFMAADKGERGGEHYWWVIRAFGLFGKSRLIAHGNCKTYAELEEIRNLYKVLPKDAMIDSGFQAQSVYRFCKGSGWKAFKGDRVQFYVVTVPHPKYPARTITVRQMWRVTRGVVYNAKTRARVSDIKLYTMANDTVNDCLAEYMTGLVGDFTVPNETEREYFEQIGGDVRRSKMDSRGVVEYYWETVGPNHYRDCERMIVVAAVASRTINLQVRAKKQDDPQHNAESQPEKDSEAVKQG